MIRYLTAGESHGPALVGIIDGLPAGMRLDMAALSDELAARQSGYGRGGRMKIERDAVDILAGVRGGITLGSPVALVIVNKDFENNRALMDPLTGAGPPITRPRPGHADYAGALKFRHRDLRNVLERASARETAMRVALGAIGAPVPEVCSASQFPATSRKSETSSRAGKRTRPIKRVYRDHRCGVLTRKRRPAWSSASTPHGATATRSAAFSK